MKLMMILRPLICFLGVLTMVNCTKNAAPVEGKIFSMLTTSQTGIDFSNTLTENDSLNYFTYSYLYMGGGVSTGDINNDGLLDLYFTGNQVSNRLYLNKGNLQFEDITDKAGVAGDDRWYTGVTMADVNGDGYLDIYCSVGGKFGPKENQLFINNTDGTFTEKATEYGVADIGNSVQATFFDYDKDGDIDMYVANYPPTNFKSPTFYYTFKMNNLEDTESDHLYRNDGGSFTDVTETAGLKNFGLTLSATVGDINNDGWPDVYVSNDFNSPDFMYLNNGNGTFKEVIKEATAHTAFYGMGTDIADINNDGNLDIFQVDMDARSNRRKKANMASMNPSLFWDVVNAGFHYQYMHNCLQLNSGVYTDGVPHFSNVSRITGTSSTDWSWGPLFADFDNDGHKDLFVSNGTRKEINNNDYFNKLDKIKIENDTLLQLSHSIPSEKIENFIFKNNGDLDFEIANDKWGINYKGFSNGVVYADLDNDGDLEIITNNIDDKASVFKNTGTNSNTYLSVKFQGNKGNTSGLGNRVYVTTDEGTQVQELTLSRGFQSSVAPELHFGLGNHKKIKELKAVWTDGTVQTLSNVDTNQQLVLTYKDAKSQEYKSLELTQLFTTDTTSIFPSHRHKENYYDDFATQVLLPHQMSAFGPALAIGDINGDQLDDYFVGGSAKQTGGIFIQGANGFKKLESPFLEEDNAKEDIGALFFDADADGDNDLYVVSGGYEFSPQSELLKDRLYINDGMGNFKKLEDENLPDMRTSGSKVYAADFDKDGDNDLLVLGRQVPGNYPKPTDSYILENVGNASNPKFQLAEKMMPKEFKELGMATSAVISDYNNDGWEDIIIVGEWMPIRVFKNSEKGFTEVSQTLGLNLDTTGWWWSIEQGDFDNDGDMDYIVGNNGLNYKYKATEDETFDIFVNDFDKDSKDDIVLSYYNEGKQYPLRGRQCSSQQIPAIKQKFQNYESFAEATLEDVYTEKSLKAAVHYQVKSFASVYLENDQGKFIVHELPVEAQLSSINQFLVNDFDKDGNLDIVLAGNLFVSEVETPRNDASHGLLLTGDGQGNFKANPASSSGLFIPGDVKAMATIRSKNNEAYIIAAKNNDYLQFIKWN
ncbi:VCBS repeat-containing protein [Maribacter sp. MAR_2009_72]|uniref:VCBS repeat-containing protein n=1 Tax=Maribacter sp. MAR_2009_72 TaxID=1250050 RepID=UPI00119B7A9A|nr:VCBS repeat-containing protein [Maribacter sp. MAR_2009_72]TVZ13989.1 VCBS repeat protein [Maribacter sp. MAR_2009_72]